MSVDKFGRFSGGGRRQRVIKGPKGDGYLRTPAGDFDIQGKRLVNLNGPTDSEDAVNLKFIDENVLRTAADGEFDAKAKRITNVKSPQNDTDAVNWKTLKGYGPSFDPVTRKISANGYLLCDLTTPTGENDAATKAYVDSHLPVDSDSVDFAHRRLKRIADPVEKSDAVNLNYLESSTITANQGYYDCKKRKLSNVSSPERLDDAVNKRFIFELLANLSYILYLKSSPTPRLWTPESWLARVLELNGDNQLTPNSLFWDELFQINSQHYTS